MNTCTICRRKFIKFDLRSRRDEYFCIECFKYEYCDETDEKKTEPQHKCKGDAPSTPKKMFSMAELLAIDEEQDNRSKFYTSKRPLQCPHLGCDRWVSVFDLRTHFEHEHIEVPIIQTLPNGRNPFTFYPQEIPYGIKKCFALINISPAMESPKNNTIDNSSLHRQKTGVTLAVLASRVPEAQLYEENNDEESNVTVEVMTDPKNNDKIVIWIASNAVCDISCTVAVSTLSEDVWFKCYGPVLQLGDRAKKVWIEGGPCLIMNPFHYLRMSDNGLKPLMLDVIVHSQG